MPPHGHPIPARLGRAEACATLSQMMDFSADLAEADGCAVVRVIGELDIATTLQLEEALATAEAGSGAAGLVVDLTATSFCDSTGMTAVLRAHKRAEKERRALVVVCPERNREVTRVLRLLGFDGILEVHDDLEAAVASARRRSAGG